MGITLVTSLNPRSEADAYAQQCAASWRQAGFTPISINAPAEQGRRLQALSAALAVPLGVVDRDAAATTGKPHVYLSDLLRAGAALGGSSFALSNSDLILAPGLAAQVAALKPDEFLFAPRIDITDADTRTGEVYAHGFDFFALHALAVPYLAEIGLIFGAPWWDHYLPLLLRASGCKPRMLRGPVAFHLTHPNNWEWALWSKLGVEFAERMRPLLAAPSLRPYAASIKPTMPERLLTLARRGRAAVLRRPFTPPGLDLHRISDANIATLYATVMA